MLIVFKNEIEGLDRVEGDSEEDIETKNWNRAEMKDETEESKLDLIGLHRLEARGNLDGSSPENYIKSPVRNEDDESISSLMGLDRLEDVNEVDIEIGNWNRSKMKDEDDEYLSTLIALDCLSLGDILFLV